MLALVFFDILPLISMFLRFQKYVFNVIKIKELNHITHIGKTEKLMSN